MYYDLGDVGSLIQILKEHTRRFHFAGYIQVEGRELNSLIRSSFDSVFLLFPTNIAGFMLIVAWGKP